VQKRIKLVGYIALLFMVLFTSVASAATIPTLNLNDNEIVTDTPPIIKNGNTLVPIRVISENLGATVSWDQTTRTATLVKDGVTINLTANQWYAKVNGANVPITWPVTLYNSRTLVPIRFIAENLGCIVKWDNQAQKVKIFYVGSNLIKDGAVGEDVKGLQTLLNDCGIAMITIDGIYGEATRQAVEKLQAEAGISVDGIVGANTRTALAAKIGANSPAAPAPTPSRSDRFGEATSWWTVNKLWPRGTVATVTDLDSGISFQVKYALNQTCN